MGRATQEEFQSLDRITYTGYQTLDAVAVLRIFCRQSAISAYKLE